MSSILSCWIIFSLLPLPFLIQVGTDIQDNKCSWLVVQALERATPEQREILEQNYAIDEQDKVRLTSQFVLAQGNSCSGCFRMLSRFATLSCKDGGFFIWRGDLKSVMFATNQSVCAAHVNMLLKPK